MPSASQSGYRKVETAREGKKNQTTPENSFLPSYKLMHVLCPKMFALQFSSHRESAMEWGKVHGKATGGFCKGAEKYTNIFQYRKKIIEGRNDSKNQHCKLEVIFTAFHNRAINRTKLNKIKGLRQARVFSL